MTYESVDEIVSVIIQIKANPAILSCGVLTFDTQGGSNLCVRE